MAKYASLIDRLYPTFEEWKLVVITFILWQKHKVYILPLRNENRDDQTQIFVLHFPFISYLWGMKTGWEGIDCAVCAGGLYPTFEEWKRTFTIQNLHFFLFISYLWGMKTNIVIPPCAPGRYVYILPLRNEN